MSNLKNKLDFVLQKIERARIAYSRHQIIRLVAVSKYTDSSKILELYNCGQRAFGENRVQDLIKKSEELKDLPLQWHFIGNIQSNKVRSLLRLRPFLIHSVSSLNLALFIDKVAALEGVNQKILLQVNSSGEDSKGGVSPDECMDVVLKIGNECRNLSLEGLMCMGANTQDIGRVDRSFAITKALYDKIGGLKILSMGMSSDYEIAIANGANMLRIGSEIFKTSF